VHGLLRAQRERLTTVLHEVDDHEWQAQSRCSEWTVHQVVRHLGDATERCIELLRGELPADILGFDPRSTPDVWLAGSAGEWPEDTIRRLEGASATLLEASGHHLRARTDAVVPFLYGPVPWSVAVLHIVWDAWVHERDIVLPLGRHHDTPAVEARSVAAYGLALAGGASAMLGGGHLDEVLELSGEGGGQFRVAIRTHQGHAQFTVTCDTEGMATDPAAEPLRGELAHVVDALVGRQPDLADALHGPAERVQALTPFRTLMLSPR
jgi:uncharacterized protein (TIGR03083 family)